MASLSGIEDEPEYTKHQCCTQAVTVTTPVFHSVKVPVKRNLRISGQFKKKKNPGDPVGLGCTSKKTVRRGYFTAQ